MEKQSEKKDIGCIGLGRIGASIVENLLDHGTTVAAYDVSEEEKKALLERRRGDVNNENLSITSSPQEVAEQLGTPRSVLLLTPTRAVDEVIANLQSSLSQGDIIIDGGNSYFKDSMRRAVELGERGIYFLDVGTSGGIHGARYGPCLMVGGDQFAYGVVERILTSIAVPGGCRHVGPSGVGHFTKMIHNFVEYGIEKCIGEGMEMLREGGRFFGQSFNLASVAEMWNHGSIIESRLLGYLAAALGDPTLGKEFENITARTDGGETGEWALAIALELKVPVLANSAALFARYSSRTGTDGSFSDKCVAAMRHTFGGHEVTYK